MFQAALTTHDIDADSAIWTSIITDDRSSCRFSDVEEVSECVHVYHNATIIIVNEKSNCAKVDNICVVESSKSPSVMPAVCTTLRAFLWLRR